MIAEEGSRLGLENGQEVHRVDRLFVLGGFFGSELPLIGLGRQLVKALLGLLIGPKLGDTAGDRGSEALGKRVEDAIERNRWQCAHGLIVASSAELLQGSAGDQTGRQLGAGWCMPG